MKKKLLALLCAVLILAGALPGASALEGEAIRAADTLTALNIVRGSYNVKDPATRAQAAVLLVRLAGAEKAAQTPANRFQFRGLPEWALPSVAYAARQGWITSTTAQGFHAESTVTGDDFCAMLLRMLGYDDKAEEFSAGDAAVFARHIGLTARTYQGALSRGDVFQILRDALTFSYHDGSGDTVISRMIASGVCPQATASALGLLDRELTARETADRHMAALFCMEVYETQKELDNQVPSSNSSGFFITGDGLAVTNYHSIEDSIYAEAILATGEVYPVEAVLYYNAEIDIAVIQICRTAKDGKVSSGFATLEMVGTADARPGDVVYTLGNPLGLGLAVSSGIIGSTDKEVDAYALPCIINTADISHGSSGGALLNVYGQVIGVTTGAYTRGNNMYIAVPVDPAMTADLTENRWTLQEVRDIEDAKAEAAKEAEEAAKSAGGAKR